jgi:hypothetical protein
MNRLRELALASAKSGGTVFRPPKLVFMLRYQADSQPPQRVDRIRE